MLSPEAYHQPLAIAWLGVLIAVVLVYLAEQIRRSPYTFWEDVLYAPTYLYGRLVWRVHFTNSPPPQMSAGAVLVANHRSSVDPFFVQLSARRRVHWMVAREYCENPALRGLLRALQVIPTNRSGMDTGATKLAIRLAREGRLVGMFPEGRLNHTRGPLVSIRPGAALVAMRAGVPMIPLHIAGSPYRREVWSPLFMPARVRITFGQPVDPRAFAEQNAAAAEAKLAQSEVAPAQRAQSPSIDAADQSAEASSQPATAIDTCRSAHSDGGGNDNGNGSLIGNGNGSRRAGNGAGERDRQAELAMAEEMMMHWGRQIVAMAGYPDWPIEVAGRSRLARTPKESL